MMTLKTRTLGGASLACALSLIACGDDDDKKENTSLDGSVKDGAIDSAVRDASIDSSSANNLGCPGNLVCVAPQGVYVCEEAGPKVITCDRQSDCPDKTMCFPLSGQGICLALCTPDEGFPATTSMTGKIVEYNAGSGEIGFGDTTTDLPVAGVKVCIASPAQLATTPCQTTDANGAFTFTGLPPNRNPAQPVGGLLSFVKDGYLPGIMQYSLGNGSQQLGNKIRLIGAAAATQIATSAGVAPPSSTTAWVMSSVAKFDLQNAGGEYSYKSAGQNLLAMSGVTITSSPAAGNGAVYLDAQEKVPAAGADAGTANGTSISGAAFWFNVAASAPASQYTLTFSHPTLNCGAANMINVVPNTVFYGADAVCGNGVAQ